MTRGRVGAQNTTSPVGNHLLKLYMTTAAMSVLPSPVGRLTNVLCDRAASEISRWYSRSGYLSSVG